jgi:hypothetical protein
VVVCTVLPIALVVPRLRSSDGALSAKEKKKNDGTSDEMLAANVIKKENDWRFQEEKKKGKRTGMCGQLQKPLDKAAHKGE